jgi:hypothetical protein
MTLQGTVVGFRRFRDAIADGDTVPYVIEMGGEWEVGYGSFTAPATLNRVTVKASSNNNLIVDFSAGQKSIWVDAIADLLTASSIAVSSVNGQTGAVVLTKSDIGLSNADNTSDANKPVSTATQTALDLKVNTSTLGAANGVATLGSDSKLTSSQLPDIAVVSYLGSAASQAAMLALTGQQGDWCIRTDLSTTWVITGANPAVIGSWTQLSYPTAPVTSVAGKTGSVTLTSSDVGLGNVDNTSDLNKPVSTATQTALNGKQSTVTVSGIVKGNGSGTLSAAVSGTDYAPATAGSAILKGNGAGGFSAASAGTDYQASITATGLLKGAGSGSVSAAVSGTDYAPATTGSAILKGNSAGGFASAAAGTDYQAPIGTISGLAKGNGANALIAAVAGTDYIAPPSGTSLLKANSGGALANAVSGTDYAPATSGSAILKGNGSGGFNSAVAGTDYVTPTGTTTLTNKTLVASGSNTVEATSGPTSTQLAGNRNKIINGAMMIDQRNAGASVTPTASGYTLDRWYAQLSQSSKYSVQQNAGAVTPPVGFINYLGITSTSAYSITSSDQFNINQRIEGLNISDLAWGTSSAKTVTLSFWVYSSLTGTFGGAVTNSGVDRSYPFSYTISAANTWEQKSITIAGDTSGTWLTTNGIGIRLYINLGAGSTLSGTAGSWAAATYTSATGATSVVGTNGATFYITGVQLEKGATATPFENRLYGTELALCQRYAYKIGGDGISYQMLTMAQTGSSSGWAYGIFSNPVTMRSSPTLAAYSAANTWSIADGVNSGALTGYGMDIASPTNIALYFNYSFAFVGGRCARIYANLNGSSYVLFSAEL